MKKAIKILSIISAVILLFGSFAAAAPCSAAGAVKKTMLQYTSMNLTFDKPEDDEYECSVENNDAKYIEVDAYNEGEYYWLMVKSQKPTKEGAEPVITVYTEKSGEKAVVRSFRVAVTPLHKVDMDNVRLNKGAGKMIEIDNPYEKDYELKYNPKKIRITQYLYDGDKEYHVVEGLRYGITRVKAYLAGTKELIGSFTVIVWNFRATVKADCKESAIFYNPHIDSEYLEGGTLDLSECIENYHADAVYTVKANDNSLTDTGFTDKTDTSPKAQLIRGKKTGSTELTVFEKRGRRRERKIGTVFLTIKRAEDKAVFDSNMLLDNDGIFYELFISPGESFDLKAVVNKNYINNAATGSHFDENEFTFSVTSEDPGIISADENGVCTCRAVGVGEVAYTVTFADGSSVTCSGSFDAVEEELFSRITVL